MRLYGAPGADRLRECAAGIAPESAYDGSGHRHRQHHASPTTATTPPPSRQHQFGHTSAISNSGGDRAQPKGGTETLIPDSVALATTSRWGGRKALSGRS